MSGYMDWPLEDARCDEDTRDSPEWVMSIKCHGNCLQNINIVFDDLWMENEDMDPCATQIYFQSANFTRTM